ncbi:electron transfer flavoprotein subunit alpha/FixB family protein [Salinarchaeum sp. IM2453]|uniref:electron transfer flavoprotein subunit alpha/FixB family protein n=1 Tax=Salinarchaeum sp. IM2453 TaxID=2862870 RepID=UPI001C83ED32|nr:electron transfer flavoprotein subunit alpha/FixB family protein [Salinarchaeum sp. IM2453]QZA89581.1 electron transfer flavoprotein subunit alpha/FixB family protein [Salinarchaeum sp. IM2453]
MSDVLIIPDHRQGSFRESSLRLATAGQQLAAETGGELHAAVINGEAVKLSKEFQCAGIDTIYAVTDGRHFNHDTYVHAIREIGKQCDPKYILTPNSVNGLDFAPAVAKKLNMPILTDVINFAYDGKLAVTRETHGAKIQTKMRIKSDQSVLTIRSSEWEKASRGGNPTVTSMDISPPDDEIYSAVTGLRSTSNGDIDITDADFVVSVGRGIESKENIELIREFAESAGATLAASRPIVDNGWLPPSRQVGQSGKTVSPNVYLAVGVSGAVQHVAGIQDANTIIAINEDPEAPIFDIADYGIVDDLFDVVPQLTKSVKENV